MDDDLGRRMARQPLSAVYAHWWEPGDPQTADEADLKAIRNAQESLRRDLKTNSPNEMADRAEQLLKQNNLPPEMMERLTYGLLEAAVKGWEIAERRTLGSEPLVWVDSSALIDLATVEPEPAARIPTQPTEPSRPLASTFSSDFIGWGKASAQWRNNAASQASASFALFLEIVGDRAIDDYTAVDGERFRATLRRIPAKYRKSHAEKDKPIQAIIADAPAGGTTLSEKTIKRHFWALVHRRMI
ncbi:MAG: hypothetical protein KJS74_07015 [Rhodospirillales bacterium]|nr:hypothetical protein [Rhodospirillales bacterium]MDE1883891.1 hypothetical protein [Rhodospirillales bacterium]